MLLVYYVRLTDIRFCSQPIGGMAEQYHFGYGRNTTICGISQGEAIIYGAEASANMLQKHKQIIIDKVGYEAHHAEYLLA